MVWERAAEKRVWSWVARGPGVSDEVGGGAEGGDGERSAGCCCEGAGLAARRP